MGLRVNNNISAINAQRNLEITTGRLRNSLQRLSSGLRITRAADDAAGLAISESFRAELRSLGQAQRNTSDAESRIRDVDFAVETAELTRNQVLQQAGISILGQANLSAQSALSLL